MMRPWTEPVTVVIVPERGLVDPNRFLFIDGIEALELLGGWFSFFRPGEDHPHFMIHEEDVFSMSLQKQVKR